MRAAVITIAGVSSRFNEGVPGSAKAHKIIYYEKNRENTLLFHLVEKCMYADRVILVGGNRYDDVKAYCEELPDEMRKKIILVYNEHYADLNSGYSLYLGLKEIFDRFDDIEDVLFVEGDLDLDKESFDKVVSCPGNVLTFSPEPIYANKAVVLYKDDKERYRYAFNSSHGLLKIDCPFSCMLNSGQTWKFADADKLKAANEKFYNEDKAATNLKIIQDYIDSCDPDSFKLIGYRIWTNCNTREDYRNILSRWEEQI